jgi:integrase
LKLVVPRKYSSKRQDALFGKLLEKISPKKGVEISRPETRAIFERMLVDHKKELSPAFQLMIFWGKQLLTHRSSYLERRRKREAVTTATIRRYFRAIGSAFLLAAENRNLTTIDQVELELLYEQTLEDRQSDGKAPQCLFQFHGFLMAFYGLPPMESIELKGATSGATNLNANLITLEIYNLVLRGLGWGKVGMSRWQRLRTIAWVICYRCGLRPSEVLNLRVIDLQMVGAEDFELLVRVSPKTERGRRRVPATLRMDRDERGLLLKYFRQRCSEIGLFGDSYLLAHPEQKLGRLADEAIYEPTRALLRSISRDDTLRLYHARHTFNSSLQVQFQLRGKPLFNQTAFLNLDVSTENDRMLRDALMGNEHWGRKDQHVQGILVGHSAPEITNQYYNHLNDVLLGSLVRQRRDAVPISLATVAMLGGLHQSWAGELLAKSSNEHPLASLVKVLAKKHADELTHPLLANATPLSLPAEESHVDAKLPPWEVVLTQDLATELRRGEDNWDVAFQLYERARRLRGKRFRLVAIIILEMGNQLENGRKRWRGPIYAAITDLRSALLVLQEIGVSAESIVLVHHPRRGRSVDEQAAALKLWQERVDLPVGGWFPGEPANATAPKKGIIELRVINSVGGLVQKEKLPPVNRGFEVAIKLLRNVLATVS